MAFFTINEDPTKGEFIPADSEFTLVSVEPRSGSKHGFSEIIMSSVATGQIGVNLDPGTYRVCVNSLGSPDPNERFNWVRTFDVGIEDMAQFKRLKNMTPKWAKTIHATGGSTWNCGFPGGCRHKASSRIGAVIHEYKEHLGMDPMKSVKPAEMKEAVNKAMRS